jgi:hypothetical protein
MSDCNLLETFIVKQFASKQRCFFFGKKIQTTGCPPLASICRVAWFKNLPAIIAAALQAIAKICSTFLKALKRRARFRTWRKTQSSKRVQEP